MIEQAANHLWQSTLVAALAGLLTLMFKRNRAQVRYWLWLAASLKFLIPFTALIALGPQLCWRRCCALRRHGARPFSPAGGSGDRAIGRGRDARRDHRAARRSRGHLARRLRGDS